MHCTVYRFMVRGIYYSRGVKHTASGPEQALQGVRSGPLDNFVKYKKLQKSNSTFSAASKALFFPILNRIQFYIIYIGVIFKTFIY